MHCIRSSGIILALLAVTTGCSSLISVNSFGVLSVIDPALAGVWTRDDETFVIRPSGSTYTILYASSDSRAVRLEGRLFKDSDVEILELAPAVEPDPFQIPVHMWVRLWPGESALRWAYLDSAWLKEQARQQLVTQAIGEGFSKRTLITSPEGAVQSFLVKHVADERAHGKVKVLQKVN